MIVEAPDARGAVGVLGLWCVVVTHLLQVVDDAELCEQGFPLPTKDLERVVVNFKQLLFPIYASNLVSKASQYGTGKKYISLKIQAIIF